MSVVIGPKLQKKENKLIWKKSGKKYIIAGVIVIDAIRVAANNEIIIT